MKPLSYSVLTLRCPRHIIKRLNGDARDSYVSEETQEGRELHRLVEGYIRDRSVPIDDIREALPYGWKTVENMAEILAGADIKLEEKVEYEIDNFQVKGYIDLLMRNSDDVEIFDLKTSHSTIIREDYKFQLALYALPFLREGYPVITHIWFLQYGDIRRVHTLKESDIPDIERRIRKELKRIEAIWEEQQKELNPNPFECQYCEYKRSCPVWAMKAETPQEIAEKYVALLEQVKEYEKILRAYVNEHGPMEVKGYVIGFHPQEKTLIDVEAAIPFLTQKYPEVARDVITVNTTKFKKWAKKIDELTSFVAVKVSPKWGVKRKEG